MKKKILVLGGGGFIGGHIGKYNKDKGNFVKIVDIKNHEHRDHDIMCHEFIKADLRDPKVVKDAMTIDGGFDEVYQLAADMGGAGYIFTGNHDADVMHNSALINLNVAKEAVLKGVKKLFYSSSACMYPAYNQEDPENPNCAESSAYPAAPDSEYGWEKLFSERLYMSFHRNYGLNVRIARFHNIFGTHGTWTGGKEKAPAAMCRKAAEASNEISSFIEVWGDGQQTRSFLYVDECIEAIQRLMASDFKEPVNIGSEEKVSINQLAQMAIDISGKSLKVKNVESNALGVRGRNSNNDLIRKTLNWSPKISLLEGMELAYKWINNELKP